MESKLCGTHGNNFEIISSYDKHYCIDACERRGASYYWCNTVLGWDYCSPEEGNNLYNSSCYVGTYCDLHNSRYRCPVNGRRQYCSIKGESREITTNGYYCSSECQFDNYRGYFWCYTYDKNCDYSSPDTDIDTRCRVCVNSQCAQRGNSYQTSASMTALITTMITVESSPWIAYLPSALQERKEFLDHKLVKWYGM